MSIKLVLFDLDGTLLPMDQEVFIKHYFGGISKYLSQFGYEPKKLIESIWLGTKDMINNDGSKTNEEAFWDRFKLIYGNDVMLDEPKFNDFYIKHFDEIKNSCGYDPNARETILKIKDMGYEVLLATNPIFPSIATRKRISWTGLDYDDFKLVTTYENSSYCKPNLKYYEEILSKLGYQVNECLMVGNDVAEDMIAAKLGMKVFLLPKCLINKNNEDINKYPHGDFNDLLEFIKTL